MYYFVYAETHSPYASQTIEKAILSSRDVLEAARLSEGQWIVKASHKKAKEGVELQDFGRSIGLGKKALSFVCALSTPNGETLNPYVIKDETRLPSGVALGYLVVLPQPLPESDSTTCFKRDLEKDRRIIYANHFLPSHMIVSFVHPVTARDINGAPKSYDDRSQPVLNHLFNKIGMTASYAPITRVFDTSRLQAPEVVKPSFTMIKELAPCEVLSFPPKAGHP